MQIPDASKCEFKHPIAMANKECKLTITLRDNDNDFVINQSEKLSVTVFDSTMKYVHVKPIKEVGDGVYEASFTVFRYGFFMIHITVGGHHIPGSPFK